MSAVDPFGLEPEEAIRWFQQKGYRLSFDWREVWGEQHARAFTVAKATQLDVLADIREAVDKAIRSGGTLGEFKKGLKPTLQAKGWWGEKEMVDPKTGETKLVQLGSAARLRTIYETNLRQAQAAGRWERMQRTKDRRPYGRYVAILDGRERAEHRAWHGTVLPLDHPWWKTHAPPNGWGCRCKMQQLSDRDLERYGFAVSDEPPPTKMRVYVNERTGKSVKVPAGIDPGFDYNPGEASRGFTPPDNAPTLEPVQKWTDLKLPPAKELRDAPNAPEAVQPWRDVKNLSDAGARWAALFGRDVADIADPQGQQITFSTRMLVHLMKGEGGAARAAIVPRAKQTIEDPTEVWMVPHRLENGKVVMRKRYIGVYKGRELGYVIVVERQDDGNAAWTTYPNTSLDKKREGYLLYRRPDAGKNSP